MKRWLLVLSWLALPARAAGGDRPSGADEAGGGDDAGAAGDEDGGAGEPAEDEIPVMVVTGSRREEAITETVVPTEVISQEDMDAIGALDAAKALEVTPGVEVERSFRGAGVRMLGLDSRYVLVLVDGQRVLGDMDGVVDLSRFSTHRIERIEVVKGTSSVLYGSDAIAGVVNLIRRHPTEPLELDASLDVGVVPGEAGRVSEGLDRDLDASVVGGSHGDDVSVIASAGYNHTAPVDWTPCSPQWDGPEADRFTADATAWTRLSQSVRMTADVAYMLRDSRRVYDAGEESVYVADDGSCQDDNAAVFDTRNLTEDVEGRVLLEVVPDEVSALRLTGSGGVFHDQYVSDQRGSDELDDYQDTVDRQAQVVGQYDRVIGGRHVATAGLEGLFEDLVRDRLTQEGRRSRLAAYVQDEWTLGAAERLVLSPGFRVDLDSKFGFHPTPRLAARWDPTDALALRGVVGQGFKAPTFQQMYLEFANPSAGYTVRGNEDLQPETSFNVYAGAELRPDAAWLFTLDLFRIALQNQITYAWDAEAGGAGDYTFDNVTSSSTEGLEAGAQYAPGPGLAAAVSYAWTYGWNDEIDDLMELVPRHRVTLRLQAAHEGSGLSGSVYGSVAGPTRYYEPDPVDVAPVAVLGAQVGRAFLHDRLQVVLRGDNLLQQGDSEHVRLSPRTFWLGLRGRFARAAGR